MTRTIVDNRQEDLDKNGARTAHPCMRCQDGFVDGNLEFNSHIGCPKGADCFPASAASKKKRALKEAEASTNEDTPKTPKKRKSRYSAAEWAGATSSPASAPSSTGSTNDRIAANRAARAVADSRKAYSNLSKGEKSAYTRRHGNPFDLLLLGETSRGKSKGKSKVRK
ncbi:hypothetical protein CC86DRAFT_405961 [Ophiobolus disseminans]|uniref:Uncharacterized protein n=1 Tax=Ophiobolus disseminans TaxID=1469910 RepID=A0A6A7A0C6_9PLEO|nr:hypothetical protein CC86DRAFT_405961 [Ophiobolus disseminans]